MRKRWLRVTGGKKPEKKPEKTPKLIKGIDSVFQVDEVTLDGSTDQNSFNERSGSNWEAPESRKAQTETPIYSQRKQEATQRRHQATNRGYGQAIQHMNQRVHQNMPVTPSNANAYMGDGTLASGVLGPTHPGRVSVSVEPFRRPASWGLGGRKK